LIIKSSLFGKVWNIGLDAILQDFAKACQKEEISGLPFHDLRHEATSRLFEKGFDTMEAELSRVTKRFRCWRAILISGQRI